MKSKLKDKQFIHQYMRQTFFVFKLLLSLLIVTTVCRAQSSDVSLPTPIFSNEIAGAIQPRDIGDARRTRYFYIFRGVEGDLIVTIESADLTGDVDVFTATTLRPLLKFTLFGGAATKASKSVYLRKEEFLILRVEARADGDANGSYRIAFGGSYAPAPPELARNVENSAPASDAQQLNDNTRRVTSTGARIERPVTESPSTVTTSIASPSKEEPVKESTRTGVGVPKKETTARAGASRNSRGSTTKTKNRSAKPPPSDSPTSDENAKKESSASDTNREADSSPASTPAPATTRTAKGARAKGTRQPTRSAPPASEAASISTQATLGQRFVLITKGGDIIECEMTLVRRITIENNQIVILLTDGKAIRQPLANVLRMSIEQR